MVPEAIAAIRLEQAECAVGSTVLNCVPDCIERAAARGRHVLGYAAVTVLKIWPASYASQPIIRHTDMKNAHSSRLTSMKSSITLRIGVRILQPEAQSSMWSLTSITRM